MARVKVYMRIAKTRKGYRADARISGPSFEPLLASSYERRALPTAAFALVLDVPDEQFARAEQVLAEVEIASEDAAIAVGVNDG